MSESNKGLDTQTQSRFNERPPEKLAPPVAAGYSLVLLESGADQQRVRRTLRMLAESDEYLLSALPCVVRRHLSLADALEAQFELACTDSIAVFIADEVLHDAAQTYLNELFASLRKSPEFAPVRVHVLSVPQNEQGDRFLRQFFGELPLLPIRRVVPRKKARTMEQWGARAGAIVECVEGR